VVWGLGEKNPRLPDYAISVAERENMIDHSLTKKQAEAFADLKRAFARCSRLNIIVWDDYGSISAVNGHKVNAPETSGEHGDRAARRDGVDLEQLDKSTVPSFAPTCWSGSNADDPLYISERP